MNKAESSAVGRSAPQVEAQEKVSGSAQYIDDLYRPNMLHGGLLQSPHAHARILGYDLTQAAAMPGVHAIITGDDLQQPWRMGAFVKDEHALAKGKVRYVGEPVAAVAAETEALARAAAAAILVTFEELPAALSPQEALAPNAAIIHEHAADYIKVFDAGTCGNLCSRTSFQEGDVERGFSDSDLIFEASYQNSAAGACLARALRRARGNGRQRPHLALVGQPIGVPRAGQCGGIARAADVAAALPDAENRRRFRQQDGTARSADRRTSGHKGEAAGEAYSLARTGFRNGPRAPSVPDPYEDRRQARRHAGRARGRGAARLRRLRRR